MHDRLRLIEQPLQPEVPRIPEYDIALTPSRPLHELKAVAPPVPQAFPWDEVLFPFSNDATAPYLQQLSERVQTKEYREAKNRVAIVVGDSHLATGAALQFMPEETIIIVDNSLAMCSFMQASFTALKEESSARSSDWLRNLAESTGRHRVDLAIAGGLQAQLLHWKTTMDRAYDPSNPEAFAKNRQLAQEKAIIPWHGDIFNLQQLGNALKEASANVTFMNLSNAIPYSCKYEGADPEEKLAALETSLASLPTTDNLPILTTSLSIGGQSFLGPHDRFGPVLASGPFFGVESLIKAGQGEHPPLGRLDLRSFFPPTSA